MKIERFLSLAFLWQVFRPVMSKKKRKICSQRLRALCKCAVLTAPTGLPLQLTALGAPYMTVLTQGNKGETTQNPCVKIALCGGLLVVSFGGSQSVISLKNDFNLNWHELDLISNLIAFEAR